MPSLPSLRSPPHWTPTESPMSPTPPIVALPPLPTPPMAPYMLAAPEAATVAPWQSLWQYPYLYVTSPILSEPCLVPFKACPSPPPPYKLPPYGDAAGEYAEDNIRKVWELQNIPAPLQTGSDRPPPSSPSQVPPLHAHPRCLTEENPYTLGPRPQESNPATPPKNATELRRKTPNTPAKPWELFLRRSAPSQQLQD
ncbi:hypothetical protein E4T56_gene9790 [Termitomyces sp. T112]|nr:hypothetical protein E4T56_gene9790 [Termitomyces sp. T112]